MLRRKEIRDTEIGAILARLALHYWRPDFQPEQVKLVLQDFLYDLRAYEVRDIAHACDRYRQGPENRFFPTPGQLLAILKPAQAEPEERHARRPFRSDYRMIGMKQATKSVAEVLADHGFTVDAKAWERRIDTGEM